ncbi:MAG TPA: MBL fold metallo-hydrolase [Rhizomicrobium sp.]|nr:MBL fold metallo-hydrolase [Rhizomicrobium sp.]
MRVKLALAGMAALIGAALPALAQPANDHLLSPDNLSQVSPHVWMIKGFPNIGIVVGTRATLVIDTGMGTKNGQTVSAAALRLSPKGQKLYLTTTHYHAEHASGDGGFPPGTEVIRPRVQQAELEAEGQKLIDLFSGRSEQDKALLQDARIRPANILFDKDTRLDLGGGVEVRLFWFGPAHTKGDELILVAPDSVLFSGDVVQNKTGPYFFCAECTPRSWIAVLDRITPLKPNIIVPDHSSVGDGGLIAQERDMLAFLQSRTAALKAEGKSADEAAKIVTQEAGVKYAGWTSMARFADAVSRAYADSNAH